MIFEKFLITGADGFVGKELCKTLASKGYLVYGATRIPYEPSCFTRNIVVGDINSTTDWKEALNGCDVIIHLAARVHVMHETADDPLMEFRRLNVDVTEHLARCAATAGIKRFVYVSSIKVNGEQTKKGERYTEYATPAPHDPYSISKWEAEQALHRVAKETGLEIVIVRPPLVYGADVKGNFAKMISVVRHGVPLPLASVNNKRSLIYVKNLADALILCATHPVASGNTYLVSDGEDVSTSDLLRKLALSMGRLPRLFLFPIFLLKLAAKVLGKSDQVDRLLGSLQVDSSKIRRELGWVAPFSLSDGLKATVKDKVL